MPSSAFSTFRYSLVDVDRLLESHETLKGTGQGKKGLGHVTRSGVVMLCAAWETYLEGVLVESVDYLTSRAESVDQLPLPVQKELASFVRNSKHQLKPLHLCGTGWKQVLGEHAQNLADALNTPKSANVDDLFKRLIGVPVLSDLWTVGATEIDSFVSVRGDIAHRGRYADYVQRRMLEEHNNNVYSAACDTDNGLSEYIKTLANGGRKPWNRVE